MSSPNTSGPSRTITVTIEQLETYPSAGSARRIRVRTSNGRVTTAHVAMWPLAAFRLRLVELEPPRPVQQWCAERDAQEALNGAFFTKPEFEPLGELWLAGEQRPSQPFRAPWSTTRGAIEIDRDGVPTIAPRDALAAIPDGDLLQAAPLLVHDGVAVAAHTDPEGLSTTFDEFDSDITAEPLPRSAIGVTADALLALCVDGRSDDDDGLLLDELAALLVELGAQDALNLDGGSSASLVTAGVRRNFPRDDTGTLLEDGYPTPTTFVFERRPGS